MNDSRHSGWLGARGAYELDTIPHALCRAVKAVPDREFIDLEGEKYSFADLDRQSNRLANSLVALGLREEDRLVGLLETSIEVFVCLLACSKIRAIWVPINLAYRGEYLRHQLADSAPRFIVCDTDYIERVMQIADRLDDQPAILFRGAKPEIDGPLSLIDFETVKGPDASPLPLLSQPDDTAMIIYTSGTTGPSKGCMLSQNQLCHLGQQFTRKLPPDDSNQKGFTCLPLFHIAALYPVFSALLTHRRAAIWSRFSVSTFWQDIERSEATYALLIASIFGLVARAPDDDAMKRCHGQLHTVIGIPIPPEIRRIWQERFGVKRLDSFAYGQTEGSSLSMTTPGEPLPPLDSAGRPAPEFDVRIFDDNDQEVPDGEIGEIVWRPQYPHIGFQGYWRQPEATWKVWRNFWMHTGDLGVMQDGYLYFKDRKKDYLRARGENISSFEVESTFAAHPAILDIAVHAVGAQTGEDEIKATMVVSEEAGLNHDELCHWAIANLPYFAVPRYYEFRNELPRNPTGKVLKYVLRDEGVTGTTWDREAAGIIVKRR